MKNPTLKLIGIVLLVVFVAAVYLLYYLPKYPDGQVANPNPVNVNSDEQTQKELNEQYLTVATKGFYEAIDGVHDPAFSAYSHSVLDTRCPFYKPDGASYRECLWGLVEEKEAVYKKTSPSSKEIDDSCQAIASDLGGLQAGEIVLLCRAFKLSQGG